MSTALVSGAKVFDGAAITDPTPTITSEPVLVADAEGKLIQVETNKSGEIDIEFSQDGPDSGFTKFVTADVVTSGDPYFHILTGVVAWIRIIFTKTEAGTGAVTAHIVSKSKG